MPKFHLIAKITGTASAEVVADTEEEAIDLAGDVDWEIIEWDLNTKSYSGGYIEAELEE